MKPTHTPYIIIILLLLIIFFQRECHRCPDLPPQSVITRVDTIRDTLLITPPPITPKPPKIEYITIPSIVDTAYIIRDYFSRKYGEDTLIDTRDLFLTLRWEVQENKPTMFQPTIINRKPTTIIQHSIPKNKYYAGINISGSKQSFSIAPSLALITKKESLYTLNYDLINKDISVGMYWKVR